jgi:hypothetical protein
LLHFIGQPQHCPSFAARELRRHVTMNLITAASPNSRYQRTETATARAGRFRRPSYVRDTAALARCRRIYSPSQCSRYRRLHRMCGCAVARSRFLHMHTDAASNATRKCRRFPARGRYG